MNPIRTVGISPKLIAAVVTAVGGYLLAQTVLELPPGVVLAIQVVLVAVGVFAARPGDVTADAESIGARTKL